MRKVLVMRMDTVKTQERLSFPRRSDTGSCGYSPPIPYISLLAPAEQSRVGHPAVSSEEAGRRDALLSADGGCQLQESPAAGPFGRKILPFRQGRGAHFFEITGGMDKGLVAGTVSQLDITYINHS